MSDYKYQVSIGWDKNRGLSLLANVPADTLDELDEGVKEMMERIDTLKKGLTDRNETADLEKDLSKPAEKTKQCTTCSGTSTYKKGYNDEKKKHWAGWFCDNKHVEWEHAGK